MIIFVYGGSGSGKSAFAEKKITELNERGVSLYYLATMKVYGDEDRERVKRHRMLRKDKGFITLEQPRDIGDVVERLDDEKSDILLECMSNLVANEMFPFDNSDEEFDTKSEEKIFENNPFYNINLGLKIKNDVKKLYERCENLVIVSNNVFDDGIIYDESTVEYIKALGDINKFLAELSDEVWEVVAGITIRVK